MTDLPYDFPEKIGQDLSRPLYIKYISLLILPAHFIQEFISLICQYSHLEGKQMPEKTTIVSRVAWQIAPCVFVLGGKVARTW